MAFAMRGALGSLGRAATSMGMAQTQTQAALGAGRGSGAAAAQRLAGMARAMSSLPSHTKLTLPALSPTMSEGVIASWLRKEGDFVEAGQPVCEIETDKATVDFEVQDDGYLARILVEAGGPAQPVGEVIGVLVEDKEDVAAFASVTLADMSEGGSAPAPEKKEEPAPAKQEQKKEEPAPAQTSAPAASSTPAGQSSGERVFASPLARKLMAENNVDLYALTGTGPNGRIIKADVEDYLASPQAQEAAPAEAASSEAPAAFSGASGDYFDVPVAEDAQELAAQLEQSKHEVPHYYLNCDIDVSALLDVRAQLNAKLPEDQQVSVNDFVVRAAALSMQAVPDVNASWGKTFIRQYRTVDINVAALTSPDDGVLMPVIRGAERKGLTAISAEMRSFVSDSDEVDLDLGVGTFTISNMGAFGVKTFTPIVRQPQGSSLGVGTITRRAVPVAASVEADLSQGPPVKIVPTMTVTLSSDHRVVDGAVGARWLQHFKTLLESPLNMLL
ncbi:Dihydrolipoyllysine-residue acetyltransferase component of pyruvate dehydrogenase complex, mitochondrial [Hondaea fermentalgiana]|uniref:Dihydrolipoamide acetyltransferase component of pyruvate dehydrogenase complex n=1 Tax=Hondaea fermentalgiana TaxID=2315210 RepID=A0A2R5G449_9STRA|nr:Dihydrolipoyllysine-residue acetyltransferase component of pyruvate dehydrogenase complex, mitochondrial [Hondaea fermentalgiana]|eukprot:GBG25806.1 Dihydrolipoyllysine-residue acetyltransferase component of pyruvate dehydrogenase complex, mitochondrial [Hondaea fermentalgiana]